MAGPVVLTAQDYPIQPVPFTAVRVTGGFWHERQEVNRRVTIPFALQQCEESKRLLNFDLAAETLRRRAAGEPGFQNTPATIYPFDDSDVYKAIEAASYDLAMHPAPALAQRLDQWIARIAAAQETDGYLYTFRTMHPDTPAHKWIGVQRWEKDPQASHELYCAGHLYEAAAAHFEATGKRTLLAIALKNAELLWRDFGDGRQRIAPGHQVIEMGLVKLYRITADSRQLKLARIFLEARGPGGAAGTLPPGKYGPAYNQQHARVVEQREAVGHAVRANYMYAGMADVAAATGDERFEAACTRIWDNVVGRKLYLTGGVGAIHQGEAYGADYELPHDAYNETCAAVALMMWSHRMFLLSGKAQYMDIVERAAHNGFLSGVSISGDRFFYPNPLVHDGVTKKNKGYVGRAPWFGCACCPPNVVRTIAALTGYCFAVRPDALYVNFYAESEGEVTVAGTSVRVVTATAYPWDGGVRLVLTPARPARFALRLRIPEWARGRPVPSDLYAYDPPGAVGWTATVNGRRIDSSVDEGYATITREWREGDEVRLTLAMPVQRVRGHAQITATRGQVAFERGPVVYCIEDTDRQFAGNSLVVPESATVEAEHRRDLLGGVTVLTIAGARAGDKPLPRVTAVPYYAWSNREPAPMAVWFRTAR